MPTVPKDLVQRQAMDHGKREKLLHQAQQLINEKVMYAPLLELADVAGLTPSMSSSAPYEELRLKAK